MSGPKLEWVPWAGQKSGGGFDRGPGVVRLELLRAEIAERRVEALGVVLADEVREMLGDILGGFEGERIEVAPFV